MVLAGWFCRSHSLAGLAAPSPLGALGQSLPFEFATPINQLHLALAQSPDHHLAAGQTQRLMLPIQLIPLAFTRHRPVALYHPLLFPTEHFVQVSGHAPMRVQRAGRHPGKTPVELLLLRLF